MFYEGFNTTYGSITDYKTLFENQTAQYESLIRTGNQFFGAAAPATIIADISGRNMDLSQNLMTLRNNILQLRQVAEQNDRDFIDTRDAMPEVLSSATHVLDTYTLFLVSLSYLIMALSVLYYYTYTNQFTLNSILIGVGAGAIITMVLFLLGTIVL